jgi:hypothetical protein
MLAHCECSVNGSVILAPEPNVLERAGLPSTLLWVQIHILKLINYDLGQQLGVLNFISFSIKWRQKSLILKGSCEDKRLEQRECQANGGYTF